jgi:hypothetical protein
VAAGDSTGPVLAGPPPGMYISCVDPTGWSDGRLARLILQEVCRDLPNLGQASPAAPRQETLNRFTLIHPAHLEVDVSATRV